MQLGVVSFMNLESSVVSALLEGLAALLQGLVLPKSSCLPHRMTVV